MVDGSSICSKVSFLKVDIDNGYERHSSSANPASAGEIGAGKPKGMEGVYGYWDVPLEVDGSKVLGSVGDFTPRNTISISRLNKLSHLLTIDPNFLRTSK